MATSSTWKAWWPPFQRRIASCWTGLSSTAVTSPPPRRTGLDGLADGDPALQRHPVHGEQALQDVAAVLRGQPGAVQVLHHLAVDAQAAAGPGEQPGVFPDDPEVQVVLDLVRGAGGRSGTSESAGWPAARSARGRAPASPRRPGHPASPGGRSRSGRRRGPARRRRRRPGAPRTPPGRARHRGARAGPAGARATAGRGGRGSSRRGRRSPPGRPRRWSRPAGRGPRPTTEASIPGMYCSRHSSNGPRRGSFPASELPSARRRVL